VSELEKARELEELRYEKLLAELGREEQEAAHELIRSWKPPGIINQLRDSRR
jgi:hypothetical protein